MSLFKMPLFAKFTRKARRSHKINHTDGVIKNLAIGSSDMEFLFTVSCTF